MLDFDPDDVLSGLRYKIANSLVKTWPFPHFFLEEVFPPGFYYQLLEHLPSETEYQQGASNYNGRKFGPESSLEELNFMLSQEFLQSVIYAFHPWFKKRFEVRHFKPKMDLRLILDCENYSIGPHTDAKWKVVSLLFYLPQNRNLIDLGTSLYIPKDPNFRCEGGPHYPFEPFQKIWTAPYTPNSVLGFFKTNYSFHGVEPIKIPCRRDILLWNLYDVSAQ